MALHGYSEYITHHRMHKLGLELVAGLGLGLIRVRDGGEWLGLGLGLGLE